MTAFVSHSDGYRKCGSKTGLYFLNQCPNTDKNPAVILFTADFSI